MPTPPTSDPVIEARVQAFLRESGRAGSVYHALVMRTATEGRVTPEEAATGLANELRGVLNNPAQHQNHQHSSWLLMVPMVGGILHGASNLIPGVGEFFSGLIQAVKNMIKGEGFDIARARQQVRQEQIDNGTIGFLQSRGIAPNNPIPAARDRILRELSANPPGGNNPSTIVVVPPGVQVPPMQGVPPVPPVEIPDGQNVLPLPTSGTPPGSGVTQPDW